MLQTKFMSYLSLLTDLRWFFTLLGTVDYPTYARGYDNFPATFKGDMLGYIHRTCTYIYIYIRLFPFNPCPDGKVWLEVWFGGMIRRYDSGHDSRVWFAHVEPFSLLKPWTHNKWKGPIYTVYVYLEPNWPLFCGVDLPFYGSFGF